MTSTASKFPHKAVWHLIDAKGQPAGRLASQVAQYIRGKHKPTFARNVDCGDHVVIINAKEVVLTKDKMKQKLYRWHTGHPGGLKERSAQHMMEKHPTEVITRAVDGMLPKNKMRRVAMRKLHVFPGAEHNLERFEPTPHTFTQVAQMPCMKTEEMEELVA